MDLDALSCYLRLTLEHFDTKLIIKNSRSKFRGGAPVAPPPPHLDPPLLSLIFFLSKFRSFRQDLYAITNRMLY